MRRMRAVRRVHASASVGPFPLCMEGPPFAIIREDEQAIKRIALFVGGAPLTSRRPPPPLPPTSGAF